MSPRRAKVLRDHGETDSPGALRRHLIDVTQRLLAAHGFARLTTREIAREAQVADGVLYNHFAGKDDLVVTALDERATELVNEFLAARPEPGVGALEENLAALARAVLKFNAGIVPLVTGLFGQTELLDRFIADIHAGQVGPQTAFAATVDYVEGEQRFGRVDDDADAVAVAELLFGACHLRGFVGQLGPGTGGGGEARAVDVDLDAIVNILLRAMRLPGQ